jgi:hypothetical protein
MIGLIGLGARRDRNSERVDIAAGGCFVVGERRFVRSGEREPSCYSYELILSPRVGMVVESFPEWRQTTFDLGCVSWLSIVWILDGIP